MNILSVSNDCVQSVIRLLQSANGLQLSNRPFFLIRQDKERAGG